MNVVDYFINWDRLDSNTIPVPESGCLIYLGYLNSSGYGVYEIQNRPYRVHRLFLSRIIGEVPDHLEVCHKCDVPCCVNPEHLFIGSHADNMRDMQNKGRRSPTPLEKRITKLTTKQVIDIRTGELGARGYARKYGVCHKSICKIIHRKTWRHI